MTLKCKAVFLGAAGTGKTSLIRRFMQNEFDKDYTTTIGIDFLVKPIQVQDKTVNLQIWDTAGQERFRSLIPSYIRDSQIAVLVYDVSDPQSFEEAIGFHKNVISECGNDALCILVGNKNDLESKVKHDQVIEFAKPKSIPTIETSAKTGQNVNLLFKMISESMPDIGNIRPEPIIVETETKEENKSQNSCFC